jgi:ABC-2 type transport system ATP-binding protein
MPILKVTDLRKSYKKGFIPKSQEVLKGISFHLPASSITGFLGANGAGKTTTMKCLLGHIFYNSGEISFFGENELTPHVLSRIGFLPERPYFYEYLTGTEFLRFYGNLSQKFKSRKVLDDRIHSLLKKVDLLHAKDKRLKNYSKGMLQKIGVAQALIHDPELVILDEPMSGLDPDGRFYLAEIIRETAKEGRCVFFSSHLLHDAETLCERIVVMTNGVVSYEGDTQAYVGKMGEASIINYLNNGNPESIKVNTYADLQKQIQQLQNQGALIVSIKPDRNLEAAFVSLGLRNG